MTRLASAGRANLKDRLLLLGFDVVCRCPCPRAAPNDSLAWQVMHEDPRQVDLNQIQYQDPECFDAALETSGGSGKKDYVIGLYYDPGTCN